MYIDIIYILYTKYYNMKIYFMKYLCTTNNFQFKLYRHCFAKIC